MAKKLDGVNIRRNKGEIMASYTPDEIQQVRDWYLSINSQGEKLFTNRQITEMFYEKYMKNISERTIYNWIKKYHWDMEVERAIMLSAYNDETVEKCKEETRELKVSEDMIEIAGKAKRLALASQIKVVKKLKDTLDAAEDINQISALCKTATYANKVLYDIVNVEIKENEEQDELGI